MPTIGLNDDARLVISSALSVRPSVCQSVCLSVCLPVRHLRWQINQFRTDPHTYIHTCSAERAHVTWNPEWRARPPESGGQGTNLSRAEWSTAVAIRSSEFLAGFRLTPHHSQFAAPIASLGFPRSAGQAVYFKTNYKPAQI